jgi:hypothetical protein
VVWLRRGPVVLARVMLAGSVLAACSSTVPAAHNEVSSVPDGIYRTQLRVVDLGRFGVRDLSYAGTWTLIVEDGAYQLDCVPITDPGVDCGNHDASMIDTVDIGTLRGSTTAVWFVHDPARLSTLTGCARHAESHRGCGPEGGYRMDWKTVSHALVFTDFVGFGDEATEPPRNEWTAHPWTRIS